MGNHRVQLPLAIAVAAVAAGAATLVLRPRDLIHPARVDATGYFSPSQLDRVHDFRGPQRVLGILALASEGAAIAWIAVRPPRRVRRALERAGARPLLGAAAVGAGAAGLPGPGRRPPGRPRPPRARGQRGPPPGGGGG